MLKQMMKRGLVAALAPAVLAVSAPALASGDEDGWHYEVAVYGWLKSVDGTSGDTKVKLDFWDDIIDLLEGVFMASFEAEYGVVSLFAGYEYTNIAGNGRLRREFDYTIPPIGPTVPLEANTKIDVTDIQHIWQAGAGYTFWEDTRSRWKILGGVNFFDMEVKAKLKQITVIGPGGGQIELDNVKVKSGDDWWTPFLGLHYSYRLSDHWRLRLRGDYGYYDSDNTSWMAEALADWRFNDWGALEIGYRYQNIDYDNDSNSDPYSYDFDEYGPRVGLIIHF